MLLTGARIVIICAPSRAFGEMNMILAMAAAILKSGGDIWLLASPPVAEVARKSLAHRVFTMSGDRAANQIVLYRIVRKYRPDLLVFSELYELLRPSRQPDCPLFDARLLEQLATCDPALAFIDFISHTPMLREVTRCPQCLNDFGADALTAVLRRLWVVLPCPLHEPAPVVERCGMPYRTMSLPLALSPSERRKVREEFLGRNRSDKAHLILRTGSTWQARLANKARLPMYDYLPNLMSFYLSGSAKPTTLVSVSDEQRLRQPSNGQLKIINVPNLPPQRFDRLLLAADLLVTDNEIGYAQAKALGRTPAVVLVNTRQLPDILHRQPARHPVGRIVREIESARPESVFPHRIFPIRDDSLALDEPAMEESAPNPPSTVRLNRMPSSPHYKAELYGGDPVRDLFSSVLDDSTVRHTFRQSADAYIQRLNRLPDVKHVVARVLESDWMAENLVL
jgi:hypothetical protein